MHYYRYENLSLWFSHNKQYAKNVRFEHLDTFLKLFSSFMHRVKLKRNSWFAPRKGDLSCHLTMHHFHAITPILLLFDKSRPEKRVNHAIMPCITLTPLRQLFCCFTYHVLKKWPITPSRQPLGGSAMLAPTLI